MGVFVALEALAALAMLALSVHGPSGLAAAALVYFAAAAGLTWWIGRRVDGVGALLGAGVLMLAAAPGVFSLLGQLERIAYERRVAATRVGEVRDQAIVSANGQPIGVRLTYTVSVPKRGYFGILPALYAREPRSERLSLNAVRWTIDGSNEPRPFEPGQVHAMVVELYPAILFIARGERCISPLPVPPLPDTIAPSPLRVVISETTYGNTYNGGREQLTRGAYDLAALYRGVLGEGLKPCKVG